MPAPLVIAKAGETELALQPRMANRHGLIAGATGTGKTVSLRVIAEQFSRIGVPVFLADIKGDLSGMARAGADSPRLQERLRLLGLEAPAFEACPVAFWDVFGAQGHPVRTTVSEMGPLLLARLLNLNEVQEGVLAMAFRIADDQGLLLLDLKDLRAMVQFVGDHAAEFKTPYGNVSAASVGAIQRSLLALEDQGAERFFGEPALNLEDLMQTDASGRGVVNILAADRLVQAPKLYATFLLWLLSELFEQLPEVGDPEKPKLAFFFDEAHLLFEDAPEALLTKIEQVVRLVRSKGVGIYFCTQNPLDLPDKVLGQLGNRVQHALRAFTPRDQKAVKAAAETFRANPGVDVAEAITQLAVGEALVSFLDDKGTPAPVQRAMILPPHSAFPPLDAEQRRAVIAGSLVAGVYEQAVDRESAFERLKAKAEASAQQAEAAQAQKQQEQQERAEARERGGRQDMLEAFGKSAARAAGSAIGRQLIRGVLGGLFGGKKGGGLFG